MVTQTPYPQPPRPLLYCICHNWIWCLASFTWKASAFFSSPIGAFPHFLYEFSCIWCYHSLGCQTKGHIYWKEGLSPVHEIVGVESCSWVSSAVISMDQHPNVILLLWLLLWGQHSQHINYSGVEPFTLVIGLQMVWTSPYFLCTHQLTEVSHQLNLKVMALVWQDFLR